MQFKARIFDENEITRAIMRMSHQIIEKNNGTDGLCIVGIRRRGVCLAERIVKNIEAIEGVKLPTGELDITLYRDDLSEDKLDAVVNSSKLDFDITNKKVILCDDVIFTGRTARAAIEALFSEGRPAAIRLAVLVDRGHRELPIRPDFIGKNVPTALSENVKVKFPEYDCETAIDLFDK